MQTFEQIITKYDRLITAEASKWIQHLWADMEDIKQEVYIIIFKRLDEILQMEDAGGYIRLITRNACRSMEYQEQKQLKDAQVSFGDDNAFEGCFSSGEIGYIKSGYFEKIKKYKHEYYLKNREQYREKSKEYYRNNKEKAKEYGRKYYEEHKEELKEYERKYYQDNKEKAKKRYQGNKEKAKEYGHKYYEEHKERCKEKAKEYRRKYYEEHKERCKEYSRKYYLENAERLRERKREYYQKNKERKKEHNKKTISTK